MIKIISFTARTTTMMLMSILLFMIIDPLQAWLMASPSTSSSLSFSTLRPLGAITTIQQQQQQQQGSSSLSSFQLHMGGYYSEPESSSSTSETNANNNNERRRHMIFGIPCVERVVDLDNQRTMTVLQPVKEDDNDDDDVDIVLQREYNLARYVLAHHALPFLQTNEDGTRPHDPFRIAVVEDDQYEVSTSRTGLVSHALYHFLLSLHEQQEQPQHPYIQILACCPNPKHLLFLQTARAMFPLPTISGSSSSVTLEMVHMKDNQELDGVDVWVLMQDDPQLLQSLLVDKSRHTRSKPMIIVYMGAQGEIHEINNETAAKRSNEDSVDVQLSSQEREGKSSHRHQSYLESLEQHGRQQQEKY